MSRKNSTSVIALTVSEVTLFKASYTAGAKIAAAFAAEGEALRACAVKVKHEDGTESLVVPKSAGLAFKAGRVAQDCGLGHGVTGMRAALAYFARGAERPEAIERSMLAANAAFSRRMDDQGLVSADARGRKKGTVVNTEVPADESVTESGDVVAPVKPAPVAPVKPAPVAPVAPVAVDSLALVKPPIIVNRDGWAGHFTNVAAFIVATDKKNRKHDHHVRECNRAILAAIENYMAATR